MTKAGNSQIMRTITLLITIFSLSFPAYAKYSGGTGDPNDPYQIATASDLMLLGESPEDYDMHFILTADIDLDPNLPGGKVFDEAVIAAGSWISSGTGFTGTLFTGDFDGNGHTILNLTIDVRTGNAWPFGQTSNAGLFGQTGDGANILNLCMESVDVTGSRFVGGLVGFNHGSITGSCSTGSINAISWYAGGLVGFNHGSESSITASYSTCTINGRQYVGGLVGENSGNITACYSTGTISGEENVGGLVGFIERGSISASYSSAIVTGNTNIGGLVGECWGGSVTMSNSTGSVVGITEVGGLVGSNRSTISSSFCTGTVSATNTVGGLVGVNSGSISNAYSTGLVIGETGVGGLVGENQRGSGRGRHPGTVNMSYSTARVSGNESVGNLVGFNGDGNIISSFWNTETSAQPASDGGIGLTTTEMQTASTFLEAGWDFVNETVNGPNDIWKIAEGLSYPRLWWEKYGGGNGEPNNPYLIYTAEHLNELGVERNDYNKHFKLMADIDFSGYLYERAVIAPDGNDSGLQHEGKPFTGVLDGNGHAISNLTIEGNSFLGLFGYLDSDAIVSNLSIEVADVNGISDFVGSLAGFSYGNIIGCCCTGDVSGNDDVGGLLGSNTIGGNITNCYSTVTVNGNEKVGGLVGYTKGSVTMCYSTGMVISEGQNVGGLVGERDPSYGIVTDCFWDTQTSGQAASAGGMGLTTTEMQTASTFIEAGWDFVDETVNGLNDIWKISEGLDYPRLWWEKYGGGIGEPNNP